MKYRPRLLSLLFMVCIIPLSESCSEDELLEPDPSRPGFISLIDDDTLNPDHIRLFHDVCSGNDIVGTFACITSCSDNSEEFYDLLHEYETEGFQVTTHCNEQKNYYRWNENLDATVYGATDIHVGDTYTYTVKKKKCPLTVEEVHLDEHGNGHICFVYMKKYYKEPSRKSGQFNRTSGSGDYAINYSDYEVRQFRNSDQVREDLSKALSSLQGNSFLDYDYLVAPYGSKDEELQQIAREMGFKCLVSNANLDIVYSGNGNRRYEIPRFGLNCMDSKGRSMSELKKLIDQASRRGGWLLVGTHIYDGWTEELLQTRFVEFVDYAKSKGIRFVTLKEGFERFASAFRQ